MAKVNYLIVIKTSDEKKAGTNEDVWIQLFGLKGESIPTHLDHGGYNDFEQGDADVYSVFCEDLGELSHIMVGLTAENSYAGEISMGAAAAMKGVSLDWQFADIAKWRSQHNSPSWHLDSVSIIPNEYILTSENFARAIRFTLRAWIPCGTIAKIMRD